MDTTPKGPIFIGGTGRSGTTLLIRLLERHPKIFTLRWESQFLVAPNGLLNLGYRQWKRKALQAFVERLRGRWYERTLNSGKKNEYKAGLITDVDREDLEAAIDFLLTEAPEAKSPEATFPLIRRFTHRLFAPGTLAAGADRWCEKTPRNVLFADRLLEIFPDLKFLHIIRDGRDVVSSMVHRGFWPVASGHEFPSLRPYRGEVTVEKAANYWRDILRLARVVSSEIPAQHYYEFRFEDLIANPEGELRTICEFLGEDFEPTMLKQNLDRHHIGRWRDDLSPSQHDVVHQIVGDTLRREGYLSE